MPCNECRRNDRAYRWLSKCRWLVASEADERQLMEGKGKGKALMKDKALVEKTNDMGVISCAKRCVTLGINSIIPTLDL